MLALGTTTVWRLNVDEGAESGDGGNGPGLSQERPGGRQGSGTGPPRSPFCHQLGVKPLQLVTIAWSKPTLLC